MKHSKRMKYVILNNFIVFLFTIFTTVLSLVKYKLYISNFGDEINGMIQTGNQLLGYLSLIEGGLTASYLYAMYKPMRNNDLNSVSALYHGLRRNIKKVVIRMIGIALIISVIYPLVINTKQNNYFYNLLLFVLLSVKYIFPYYVILVPKTMIILKERKFEVELIAGVISCVDFVFEILLIRYTKLTIHLVLLLSLLVYCCLSVLYTVRMKCLYNSQMAGNKEIDTRPVSMSKDVMAHNISALIFTSTDTIILSVFSNMHVVSVYAAYNSLITKGVMFVKKMIEGVDATLGLKVAGNDKNVYSTFKVLFIVVNLFASITCGVFVCFINLFVELWIGREYLVSNFTVYLMAMIIYANIILPVIYSIRNAKGLYRESKKFTIGQAILNIGISLVLVGKYNILGVLIGTAVSRFFITIPFNIELVYRKIFCDKNIPLLKWGVVFSLTVLAIVMSACFMGLEEINISMFYKIIMVTSWIVISCSVIYLVMFREFRQVFVRLIKGK